MIANLGSNRPLLALLLLLTLLAVALAMATPEPLSACSIFQRCGSEFYYFSDASHTEMVGYRGWECNPCNYSHWGQITSHYEWYAQPCCN